jgi:hypothetical protein
MTSPIDARFCKHCGQPAVDARIESDGTMTYLCIQHAPIAVDETEDDPLEERDKRER